MISAERARTDAGDLSRQFPEIMQDFSNPANELTAKHNVIDRVFPTEIRSFLKLLCDEDADHPVSG